MNQEWPFGPALTILLAALAASVALGHGETAVSHAQWPAVHWIASDITIGSRQAHPAG